MLSIKRITLLLSLTPLLMLLLALLAQFGWGWEPCTMCVEIRFLLMAGSLLGLASLVLPGKSGLLLFVPATFVFAAAAFLNTKLVLLERGVIDAFSCSPFPFYSHWTSLQDWMPSIFMSAGICGQNDHLVLGVSFTIWTLIGIVLLALVHIWHMIRQAKA